MYSLLFLGFASFTLSLLLTPLVRNLAWHFGVIDQPDQERKIHKAPIPRMGGVAIFASVVAAYGLLLIVGLSSGSIVHAGLPLVLKLMPAIVVVFGVGILDDIFSIRPLVKLGVETLAAILAWAGGVQVFAINGYSISGNITSFLVTVLWIVLCTNAVNLIDGVDGLAAGVSFFAASTMLISGILEPNYAMALAVVPLVGSLLGFLRYNFAPATIFLGDSGSLTIGFLLGCFGALWVEKSTTLLGLTAPLMVLAIPILDVGLAVTRRAIHGKPLFTADDAHIHHKLLSLGMTPRRLLAVVYAISAVGSAVSILLTLNHNQNRDFVLILVCLAAWLGLQHLGYSEFGTARRIFFGGTIRSALSTQFALEAFEREMNADLTIEQTWNLLCSTCSRFGFSGIVFDIDGVNRMWGDRTGWQAHLDFPGHGRITVWRDFGVMNHRTGAVLFIECVSRSFTQKLLQLELVNDE